ncbi:MAG: hypothetical protein AAF171_00480 [Cyanobacteria bacterium P01_A01_bin.116]
MDKISYAIRTTSGPTAAEDIASRRMHTLREGKAYSGLLST